MYLLRESERSQQVIRTIDVKGDFYFGPGEVLRMSGLKTGRSISGKEIQAARRALEVHPVILKARIRRGDSERLVIGLEQRRCAAIVRTGLEEKNLYEVDEDL